jgi:hypothetical protein
VGQTKESCAQQHGCELQPDRKGGVICCPPAEEGETWGCPLAAEVKAEEIQEKRRETNN